MESLLTHSAKSTDTDRAMSADGWHGKSLLKQMLSAVSNHHRDAMYGRMPGQQ